MIYINFFLLLTLKKTLYYTCIYMENFVECSKVWAACSWCLPFYNHSNTPNIKKHGDLTNDRMTVTALRDIKKGEELVGTYYSRQWRECFKELID